jgi:hypothetical protein
VARRSYLARIAQPVTAAVSVAWPVPRAAPEMSRPTVEAPRPPTPRGPTLSPSPEAPSTAQPDARSAVEDRVEASRIADTVVRSGDQAIGVRPDAPAEPSQVEAAYVVQNSRSLRSPTSVFDPGAPTLSHARGTASGSEPRREDQASPTAPAARTLRDRDAPPRLHIGTIEIRASQPAPPVFPPQPAPPMASAAPAAPTSLARPYATRFGLAQG